MDLSDGEDVVFLPREAIATHESEEILGEDEEEEDEDHRHDVDEERRIKYQQMSFETLVELALAQDKMIYRLQKKLDESSKKEAVQRRGLDRARDGLKAMQDSCEARFWHFDQTLTGLSRKIDHGLKRVDEMRRGGGGLEIPQVYSLPRDGSLSNLSKAIYDERKAVSVGTQTVDVSFAWTPVANEFDDVRVCLSSQDSHDAVLQHLLDCWDSVTRNALEATRSTGIEDLEEHELEAFFLGESRLEPHRTDANFVKSEPDARQVLEKWLDQAVKEMKPDLVKVLELGNLPREVFDGFLVHVIPRLWHQATSIGCHVDVAKRVRVVSDLQISIRPNATNLIELIPPNRQCFMCRELFFSQVPSSQHHRCQDRTFNQLCVYNICLRCLGLCHVPSNRRLTLYHEQVEQQLRVAEARSSVGSGLRSARNSFSTMSTSGEESTPSPGRWRRWSHSEEGNMTSSVTKRAGSAQSFRRK